MLNRYFVGIIFNCIIKSFRIVFMTLKLSIYNIYLLKEHSNNIKLVCNFWLIHEK